MAAVAELFNQAVLHHQNGALSQAESLYRQIIQADPAHAEALHFLGIIAMQTGHSQAAIALIRRAIALKPGVTDFSFNLGVLLKNLGQWDEAIACFQQVLDIQPNHAEAVNNLGLALIKVRRLEEAAALTRRRLVIFLTTRICTIIWELFSPKWDNLVGPSSVTNKRYAQPAQLDGKKNLANAYYLQGRLVEAEECYRQMLRQNPQAEIYNNLGAIRAELGDINEAIACYKEARTLEPQNPRWHSKIVFTSIYHPDYDSRALYDLSCSWEKDHALALTPATRSFDNLPVPERRLRVGYVSPNFRAHSETFFTLPLFAAHDHEQFEIFFYSDVAYPDDLTARIQSHADVWRNTRDLADPQLAQLIRQDHIDILVDLTMHMADNRLLVFARVPAPIQICWLAYQGTTGLSTMDYRLTDTHVDPYGLFESFYSEKSVFLPDAFGCYDPLDAGTVVGKLPALANGYITFGCFNSLMKINATLLRYWAAVLRATMDSRVVILAHEGAHRQNILDLFELEGVARERVSFAVKCPRLEYLRLYEGIDISLDTLPYNGQTTTLDSLWMGVPVLTLAGQTAVGRASLSILRNLGRTEWIAETPQQLVSNAVNLGEDLQQLIQIRATLRERLQQSPLMDGPRFARNVEFAYRTMWRKWCRRSHDSSNRG